MTAAAIIFFIALLPLFSFFFPTGRFVFRHSTVSNSAGAAIIGTCKLPQFGEKFHLYNALPIQNAGWPAGADLHGLAGVTPMMAANCHRPRMA
jgi:hypothetical protein